MGGGREALDKKDQTELKFVWSKPILRLVDTAAFDGVPLAVRSCDTQAYLIIAGRWDHVHNATAAHQGG